VSLNSAQRVAVLETRTVAMTVAGIAQDLDEASRELTGETLETARIILSVVKMSEKHDLTSIIKKKRVVTEGKPAISLAVAFRFLKRCWDALCEMKVRQPLAMSLPA